MAKSLQKTKCILAVAPLPISNTHKHLSFICLLVLCSGSLVHSDPDYCCVHLRVILLYSFGKNNEKFTPRVNVLSSACNITHFQTLINIFPSYICWFFQCVLVFRDPDYCCVNFRVILLYSFGEN